MKMFKKIILSFLAVSFLVAPFFVASLTTSTDRTLPAAVSDLKTPQEVVQYLNNNFKITNRTGNQVSPESFISNQSLRGEQDFAAFASYVLYHNNIFATVFVYQYLGTDGLERTKYLPTFNDNGTPGYIYFTDQAYLVASYGRNSLELCQKEEQRTGLKITKYSLTPALSTDLVPGKWESFSTTLETTTPVASEESLDQETVSSSFDQVANSLKTSQSLVQHLNNNFKFVSRTGNTSLSPADFIKNKQGGEQDFAVFAAQTLYHNNLVSIIVNCRYLGTDNKEKDSYLVSFNESGIAKYIYFDSSGANIVNNYGSDFMDLCQKEKERTNRNIVRFGLISPITTSLAPTQWSVFESKKVPVTVPTKPTTTPATPTVPTTTPSAPTTPVTPTKPTTTPAVPTTTVPVQQARELVPSVVRNVEQVREEIKVYREEAQAGVNVEEKREAIKEIIQKLSVANEEEAEKIEEFEDPRIEGIEATDIYEVMDIMVQEKTVHQDGREDVKKVVISGKGPPNSIVFLYIYSTPIIVSVRTDSDGNWSYVLEKEIEDGNHEIYVASVDNSGKVIARSNPLPFVKEAAAVQIGFALPPGSETETPGFFSRNILFILLVAFALIVLITIIIVGTTTNRKKEPRNV
jgi:hypothetical protein